MGIGGLRKWAITIAKVICSSDGSRALWGDAALAATEPGRIAGALADLDTWSDGEVNSNEPLGDAVER